MTSYTADGFRSIRKGADVGDRIVESIHDAARVFAGRLARRRGKRHRALVNLDSWTSSSALYQVDVVAPNGTADREWLHVFVE